jgi:hypothetical protein
MKKFLLLIILFISQKQVSLQLVNNYILIPIAKSNYLFTFYVESISVDEGKIGFERIYDNSKKIE